MPRHQKLLFPIRAAGIVLFRRDETGQIQYLFMLRNREYHWIPPKGHHKRHEFPNETDMDIAMREMEQCGFAKDDFIVYEDAKDVSPGWQVHDGINTKVATYWLAELVNKKAEVKMSESYLMYRWVTYEEAVGLIKPHYQETLDMMSKFHNYVKQKFNL